MADNPNPSDDRYAVACLIVDLVEAWSYNQIDAGAGVFGRHRNDPTIGPIFDRAVARFDALARSHDFTTCYRIALTGAVLEVLRLGSTP